MTSDVVSDIERRLDEMERRLDEMKRSYERGIEAAYREGYATGIRNGKRLANGKPEWPKSKGRPQVLDNDIMVLNFIDAVRHLVDENGITVAAAISRCRQAMKPLWKEWGWPNWSQKQLLDLYNRATKPNMIDDDTRRTYERLKCGWSDA